MKTVLAISIPLVLLLIYAMWIIRCIKNAYEEKECEVTESKGLEVNEFGNLVETITATFHQA
jgi:Na+-transporting methylmalonyl-CoA/oxaloacetate decarboxylase gamma subunit